MTVTTKHPMKW